MSGSAEELVAATRKDLERAAESIIDAATRGLDLIDAVMAADGGAADALRRELENIVAYCAFEDIAGQRLSKLASKPLVVMESRDQLLAGPQAKGRLAQAAADALFADASATR